MKKPIGKKRVQNRVGKKILNKCQRHKIAIRRWKGMGQKDGFRGLGFKLHKCSTLISFFILIFYDDLPINFKGSDCHGVFIFSLIVHHLFQRFLLSWCVHFSLIVHHLEDMKGLTLELMVNIFFKYKV